MPLILFGLASLLGSGAYLVDSVKSDPEKKSGFNISDISTLDTVKILALVTAGYMAFRVIKKGRL